MIITHLKQAWQLLRQNKLFSGIYIAGTALAIASTTIFAVIYYVKLAPVYPEYMRDRIVTLSTLEYDTPYGYKMQTAAFSYDFLNDFLYHLENAEAVDRAYWPDRRGINGKRFIDPFRPDTAYLNVVGIIKDVRYKAHVRTNALVIRGATPTPPQYINELTLVVRLQEGIDADSYFNDHHDHITEDLSIGNFFVRSVKSQRQLMEEGEYICGITSKRDIMLFVATLFLLNLVLGVTGSVWLQTGKRINELGVLRSYGASRSKIMKMLFGEALVLASAAFVIGEIIYLQYAFSNNLSEGFEENSMYLPTASWVNDFTAHFAIVSAIIYVILIICVCIGTYFPARHASRISPVDALRDE